MKKIIFCLIIFLTSFSVNAAAVDLYASRTSVTVGDSIIITVKTNDAMGKYSLSSSNSNIISGGISSGGFKTPNEQATYTFKANNPGSATITFTPQNMALFSNDTKYEKTSSITIKVNARRQLSTNNNLSSLGIDGVSLNPEFNSDTVEYSVELEAGTEKINVTAAASDSNASVSGTGEREVTEGDNNIEVVVTAENGATKTYTIKVTVKEFNPIKVKIGKEEYTVVRNKKNLTPPNNYEETSLTINDEEVPAYQNKITKYTIVALKDSKGNQNWYVKEKDNYKLYKEYKFSNTILYPMELEKIPTDYFKTSIKYNEETIVAYKLNDSSKYALIYAMNVETGKTNIYMYDSKEDTVQIYNDEHVNKLVSENELYLKILIGVSAGLVLSVGTIIFLVIKNKKTKSIEK